VIELQAFLAAIVESSDDGIISKTLQGVIQTWNKGAERIFGYTAEEAVGKHIFLIIPEERRSEEDLILGKIRAGERLDHFETVRRRKDGKYVDVAVTVSPIKDAAGQIIGASKIVRDVTEKKRFEDIQKSAAARFQFLADSMPQKVWTATPSGDIDYVNKTWLDYIDLTWDQFKDWGWQSSLHPDDVENTMTVWKSAIASGEEFQLQQRFKNRQGEYRWHLSRGRQMKDGQGKPTMWVGTNTDIHDQKLTEQRLASEASVARALAEAFPLRQIMQNVLKAVGEATKWECGSIWLPDGDRLRCGAVWPAEGELFADFRELTTKINFAPGVGLPGKVWVSGETSWVEDIGQGDNGDNFPRKAAALQSGLHAALCFAASSGGSVRAVIEFFSRNFKVPDNVTTDLMRTVGEQVGEHIERRFIMEQVRSSQARKAGVLAAALDAIIEMDAKGNIIEWNPAAQTIFGYSAEEVVGKELAEVVIPERFRHLHRKGLEGYLQGAPGPNIGTRLETFAVRRDGTEFPVELAVNQIQWEGPPTFTGHIRDITERKNFESKLLEANKELEQFAYVASHDLKAPLRGVMNLADWIVEELGTVSPKAQEYIALLQSRIRRMNALIDGILQYSRVGRMYMEKESIDPRQVVLSSWELLAKKDFVLKLPDSMPEIMANPIVAGQVFSNLLSNAIKHHTNDPNKGVIEVGVKDAGPVWEFFVKDDGPGIHPNFRNKIFGMFQTALPKNDNENTGVGLALCKKIVQQNGGQIRFESEFGHGTTFYFTWKK
jgi:two-component system sensor kinase FixL